MADNFSFLNAFEQLRSRARRLRRIALPVLLAAGAAVTCDNPTGPARRTASLALQPKINIVMGAFGGLTVDQARLIAVRGADTVSQTFAFSPDSTQITRGLSVPVTDTATYLITIQLLSGTTVMFSGQISVLVTAGQLNPPPVQVVELAYVGPGLNVDSIRIAPRDSFVTPGGQLQFRLAAWDSSGNPVTQFYAAWSTGSTANTVNADGLFRAGTTKSTVWVYAHTPTGNWDSTQVTVGAGQPGVPTAIAKVAGDGQSAAAGTAVAVAPQVKVTDAFGNPVSGVAVTFAVASGGGSITGAGATTNALGLASVGSWTLGTAAGTNTLTASVTGLAPVTFTATAVIAAATITISVPGSLVGVGAQGLALVKLAPAAPSGGVTVTVTSDSTQYLTVASPGTIAFAAGDTLKSIALNGVAAGVSILHASATGYTSGSTPVAVTPNVIVLTPPATLGVGQRAPLTIQLVPAAPSGGVVVTLASTDTTKVKLVASTVSFAASQSTGVDTVVGAAPGVAGITATATGYAEGATAVSVAGAAKILTLVSGGGQSAPADSQLPLPVVVKVSDSLGTAVSGVAVAFAVATGGGSVGTANATTNSSGQASTTWRLGSLAGIQTLTATSTGLTGSPLTVSATATTGIASTTVTPKLDTITAINGTFTLVAQAKDASGNNVTGSFTWTSRNTATATVTALGVVTGLANGSTYVVATEAGGTKDSALIVVQQKLASINVTPANRNLYLGTTFNYTAQAVDGLGTPLPVQPTFTWSSSAPAVATVDSTGHVSAIGIGSAQIKATSGTVTGIGNLGVITAITRIAVAMDTLGSQKTDTFTLPSLGATRRYHAYAFDTVGVLMTSVTQFTWASSNPSVAGVPNQTSDTATATSAANGVTTINATAQGFTSKPGALLNVSQVLASIQLSPTAAAIAVGGTAALTARGLDANSHYISGLSFTYRSTDTTKAIVGATTGLVTGVAVGTDTVYADSGAMVSNPAVITVAATVPAAISFGRDTVSVGRGSSASIPILLSTPVPAGGPSLTINLGVSPAAYAHWATATVTIPAGGQSVNATLAGDSAGTTTVTASDGSGLGYASGSAVAKVTANMSLASSYYYVNATDVATSQVLLSDPSPAGGTYVTFSYGTAGIASVSPDPAYIPAGQLAADIQINAVASGTTTITPVAIGVNGSASSFTAYAPVLTMYPSYELVGLGQYYPYGEVYLPTNTLTGLTVTLTSSDTTKATVPPTVTIQPNTNYIYFNISSAGLGRAAIAPSASGWTARNVDSVTVTTPHVGICCSNTSNLFTNSGTQYLYLYAEDSTGSSHPRTNSLLVSLRSSDSTVMRVIDADTTINPGAAYMYGARVTPGGSVGTAYVVASASGHTSDSVVFTVQGPPLNLSWTSRLIGAGQEDVNGAYVSVPNAVPSPLVVTLANTDTTKASLPATVTIPTGTTYVYFTVVGVAPGTDTIRATATGYQYDSATITVTTPGIAACCNNSNLYNFSTNQSIYAYSVDSAGTAHARATPLAVSLASSNTAKVTTDSSSVTIAAGSVYSSYAHALAVDTGSALVILSAAGQRAPDTLTYTVTTPPLSYSFVNWPYTQVIGRRQHFNPSGSGIQFYTPNSRTDSVPLTVTQKNSKVDSVSTLTPLIPANSNYVYVDAFGLGNGTDTLTVTATGYVATAPTVTVSTPRLTSSNLPTTATTTSPPIGVNVYATDSLGYSHYTMDTVVVKVTSSDTTVLKPESTYYHIPKNGYYVPVTVNIVGPATASIIFSDSANSGYRADTTNTVTVTGPALSLCCGTLTNPYVLGMRQMSQTGGSLYTYVYTSNAVTAPLVVRLLSTDTTVATVADSVVIPTGSSSAYFIVTGRDTTGTIQIQATATGYSPSSMTVKVTQPKFVLSTSTQLYTTSQPTPIYVYAADANGGYHNSADSVVARLASSATSVATIDSATVTIPTGQYYNGGATWGPTTGGVTGTAQLSATDTRVALYAYTQATDTVTVLTPTLYLSWGASASSPQSLGIGQYIDYEYVSSPTTVSAPLNVSFTQGATPHMNTYANGTATPITGVTIPTGSSYAYFRIQGASAGTDTLVASSTSPPYNPVKAYTAVGLGRVDPISNWPGTLSLTTNDSVQVTMYTRDPAGNGEYVADSTTFTLRPSGGIVFVSGGANSTVITSVVVPAGSYYVTFWVKGVSTGTGSAAISATNYTTYSTPTITVSP